MIAASLHRILDEHTKVTFLTNQLRAYDGLTLGLARILLKSEEHEGNRQRPHGE